jgi:hypothetical protein
MPECRIKRDAMLVVDVPPARTVMANDWYGSCKRRRTDLERQGERGITVTPPRCARLRDASNCPVLLSAEYEDAVQRSWPSLLLRALYSASVVLVGAAWRCS